MTHITLPCRLGWNSRYAKHSISTLVLVFMFAIIAFGNNNQSSYYFKTVNLFQKHLAKQLNAPSGDLTLTVPADITVQCSEPYPATQANASTICNGNVQLHLEEKRINETCTNEYDFLRIWTATDLCNNIAVDTQIVHVVDTEAPTITMAVPMLYGLQEGDTIFVSCDAPAMVMDASSVRTSDNCDSNVDVEFIDYLKDIGDCNITGYRELWECGWVATDDCGNSTTFLFLMVIIDDEAPQFGPYDAQIEVECDNIPSPNDIEVSDNCTDTVDIIINYSDVIMPGDCEGEEMLMRQIWAWDECGNSDTIEQVIMLIDTTAPQIFGVPDSLILSCMDSIPDPVEPWATDNCSSIIDIELTETSLSNPCAKTLIRTWTATDDCGNSTQKERKIILLDTIAPSLLVPLADTTINCDANIPNDFPLFEDNCQFDSTGQLTITLDTLVHPASCGYRIEKLFTVTDPCSNSSTYTQWITVVDTIAPELIDFPQDTSVLCTELFTPENQTAIDNCDASLTINFGEVHLGDSCHTRRVVRTWTTSDNCGNTTRKSQTIWLIDTIAPEILNVPLDTTLECNESPDFVFLSTADNCYGGVSIEYQEASSGDDCNTYLTRTWKAIDDCGNFSTASQVVTFTDFTAPDLHFNHPLLVNALDGDTIIFECDSIVTFTDNHVIAIDNCDDHVDVTFTEITNDSLNCESTGYLLELLCTWTAEDDCGNTSNLNLVIQIIDTKAPEFLNIPNDITIACDDDIPDHAQVSAVDNCTDVLDIVFNESFDNNGCIQTITRTWETSDDCGNITSEEQVITRIDTIAPHFQNVQNDTIYSCLADAIIMEPQAFDNCTDVLSVLKEIDTIYVGNCTNDQILEYRWTTTDNCGNTSIVSTEITIKDTIAPLLINSPQSNYTIECDDPVPSDFPEFEDNCANVHIEQEELIELDSCGYTINLTWTASDDCGNETSFNQSIHVIDSTAPVLVGVPDDMSLDCESIPPAANVSATDNCDTSVIVVFNQFMQGVGNNRKIIREWSATDNCGNTTTAAQEIDFTDNEAPTIDSIPDNFTINCHEPIPDPIDPKVSDNCDTLIDLSFSEVLITGTCPQEYSIIREWTATDDYGNATTIQQTIFVIDTIAPVLSFNHPLLNQYNQGDTILIACDSLIALGPNDVIAPDNCDSAVVITFNEVSEQGDCINDGYLEKLYCWWTATDACGNQDSIGIYMLIIDTEAPTFTTIPEDIDLNCEDDFPDPDDITVVDNCFANPTLTYTDLVIGGNCADNYSVERTWFAKDLCGNSTGVIQHINVSDTEAPLIVLNVPGLGSIVDGDTIIFNCDNLIILEDTSAIITDNCDVNPEVTFDEVVTNSDNCELDGYKTRMDCTWYAEDNCGNKSSLQIFVFVVDATPPVMHNLPDTTDLDLPIGTDPSDPNLVTATDNCDGVVPVNYADSVSENECVRTTTRIWTATDECGNQTEFVQKITQHKYVSVERIKVDDATCGQDDGSVSIYLHGGNEDSYIFDWQPNFGVANAANNHRTDLPHGDYTVRITNPDNPTCNISLSISVNCIPGISTSVNSFGYTAGNPCQSSKKVFEKSKHILSVDDCDADRSFCLNMTMNECLIYDFEVNKEVYSRDMSICSKLPYIQFAYDLLLFEEGEGNFLIENLNINGIPHTGSFTNIQDLLQLLNNWDSATQWLENPTTQTIRAYHPTVDYGLMRIYNENTGSIFMLNPNHGEEINSVGLMMPVGTHKVIAYNKSTGCMDSTEVEIVCITSAQLKQDIEVDEVIQFEIPVHQLPGKLIEIEIVNIYPDDGCVEAKTVFKSNRIEIQGQMKGVETITAVCKDEFGFNDTTYIEVNVRNNDALSKPKMIFYSGFSPNWDGHNDYFKIENIDKYPDSKLSIFNRYGNLVFEALNYQNDWDGKYDNNDLPDGVYFYVLKTGENEAYSGYIQIER